MSRTLATFWCQKENSRMNSSSKRRATFEDRDGDEDATVIVLPKPSATSDRDRDETPEWIETATGRDRKRELLARKTMPYGQFETIARYVSQEIDFWKPDGYELQFEARSKKQLERLAKEFLEQIERDQQQIDELWQMNDEVEQLLVRISMQIRDTQAALGERTMKEFKRRGVSIVEKQPPAKKQRRSK